MADFDLRIVRGFVSESGAHYLPMRGVVRRLTIPLCVVSGLLFVLGCGTGGDAQDTASNGSGGTGNGNGGTGNGNAGDAATAGAFGNSGTGGSAAGPTGPYLASESIVRRLSRAELDNTIADLLGDTAGPAGQFLPEDQFSPYDNDYTLQLASAALIDSLERLADDVAARIIADPALQAALVPCTPVDDGDAACFTQVVSTLLPRAYRRPVTAEEIDRYAVLLEYATEANADVPHDFYTAVQLLLRSILQDPEFLYRIEVGTPTADPGVYALSDHEIATRLSYLFWGTLPDQALTADAAAGTLADATTRRSAIDRLLTDDRAHAQLRRFHSMWLGYRALPHDAALVSAFSRETGALIDRVVWGEPQNYLNLFTSPETFIDATLAEHYGLPAPAAEGWVSYGDSGRAGILSHGALLSAFGKFSDTSPTQRGIFVRTRLMCEPVAPPPPNVNSDQPPASMDAVCKADRYEQHRTNTACAACHSLLDPIGFGLENYNLAGQRRETDNDNVDCAIDGQGEVLPYGPFSGPAELAALLVDNNEIDDCVVRQWMAFAVGRPLLGYESAPTDQLVASFRGTDHSLQALLADFAASPAFALRQEAPPTP